MRDIDKINEILECATLAPSIDNCQPWRFSISGNTVELRLDRPRAEFFGDFAFTASYATMGAVVENIVIAAQHLHMKAMIECFPEGEGSDPVVRIAFEKDSEVSQVEPELFPFIATRCTNRKPYPQVKLAQSELNSLYGLVGNGARLLLVDDSDLVKQLSKISEKVDQIIFEHRLLHENLFRWMRWTDAEIMETQDGMGVKSLELNFADQCAFRMISSWPLLSFLNLFGVSRLIAKINSGLICKSAAVGLLFIKGSANYNYFSGGRLLERIWLQTAAKRLSFQPYGGMPFLLTRINKAGNIGFSNKHYQMLLDVKKRLDAFADIKDDETLIMMFRLGYADLPSERTKRRPLAEVLSEKA